MNSRSSVNESNLVNLSGDLSALNQLDTKESLSLSFPFDHLYACHSDDSERRQALDREVEISTLPDDKETGTLREPGHESLTERLNAAEVQNKRLKSLLLYHLDLIQQQNELLTKTEKQNSALKQENDTLRSKVTRGDRRITVNQRHNINPPPVLNVPTPSISATIKHEPGTTSESQITFNTIDEFLVPERPSTYIFNNDNIAKTKPLMPPDTFDLNRPSETDVTTYLPSDISVPSILESSSLQCDNFSTMIENKRSYIKKEIKTEPRPEPLYTVTSNSGNTVIQKLQRCRRRTSGSLGSLSRLPKTPAVKTEPPENVNVFDDDNAFERTFSVNKKSKMINTYGKNKTTTTLPKKTVLYTGSLSDRLQLIDTTPTGEDPYQLGEADMREQSPIPKLMLQKSNPSRLRIYTNLMGESTPTRRIYDAPATETSTTMPTTIKLENRYHLPNIIPYTVPQTSTLTSTQTSADSSMNMSTFTHMHTFSHTPKQTSTLTSTNANVSTYSTPKNTATRTSSTYKKSSQKGSQKTSQSSSRKSSTSKQNTPKGQLKGGTTTHTVSLTSPNTSLHLTPLPSLHTAPLMSTQLSLHSATFADTEIKTEPMGAPDSPPTLLMQPDMDQIKKEPELDWPLYTDDSLVAEASLCDFSYGENSNSVTLPPIDVTEFRNMLSSVDTAAAAAVALENMDTQDYNAAEKMDTEKIKKKGGRTTTSVATGDDSSDNFNRRGVGSKRGRKRALSTAGLSKAAKKNVKAAEAKPRRGKAASRGKKSPVPGMTTTNPYYTMVGGSKLTWFYAMERSLNMGKSGQGTGQPSIVEVPSWRERPFASLFDSEGIENLDDKVFEKRHQKLEAEERRQLRWHMRRIREQRHVERLRMRQRDHWYSGHSHYQPSVYTIWPQPQRDVRMIEITDTIPVMAFGEELPDLPPADFMLPWVRTSKALKRSKRSKTLH